MELNNLTRENVLNSTTQIYLLFNKYANLDGVYFGINHRDLNWFKLYLNQLLNHWLNLYFDIP